MPIDFVIPWVDGADKEWREIKNSYISDEKKSSGINGEERYRDWGILHYWFRAVEKYAPWVRKIHFITCGHVPEWLNLNHPKINFVKHEDYIPREWLPTFSARVIELNIFRIKDISEKFVFFNDDMFLNAPVKPEDFFMNNLPRASCVLNLLPLNWGRNSSANIIFNCVQCINQHFDFRAQLKKNFGKYITLRYGLDRFLKTILLLPFKCYTGFFERHNANSFLKSTFQEVWEKESDWLCKTSSHRFRDNSDASQWLMEYWQFAKGNFYPRSLKFADGYGGMNIINAVQDIKNHKHKIICLNDDENITREKFHEFSKIIQQAYSEILPEKSSFEL